MSVSLSGISYIHSDNSCQMRSSFVFYIGFGFDMLLLLNVILNTFFAFNPSAGDTAKGVEFVLLLVISLVAAFVFKSQGRMLWANLSIWIPVWIVLLCVIGLMIMFIGFSAGR